MISQGDSIRYHGDGYYWLNVDEMDTVRVDSLWFRAPPDSVRYMYSEIDANYARIANSRFLNIAGEAVRFNGRELVVDTTEFRGCDVCAWTGTAYGVQAYAGNDSGPRVTMRGSTFFNLYYALSVPSTGDSAGPVFLSRNTADSVYYGFSVNADSVEAVDNVITRAGVSRSRTGRSAPR
jgi:hypothetical protein